MGSSSKNMERDTPGDIKKLFTINNTQPSNNCEIAIWNESDNWLTPKMIKDLFPDIDAIDVMGYVDIEQWLKIIKWCENE